MGDGRFGRDDEEFGFGEVQLEVVLGHPGRDVCEAGLNPGLEKGIFRFT